VFWDRSVWRMIVGAGYADGTAAVLSFSSADLNEWTFDGVAAQRHVGEQQPIWTGQVWECPQLVAIGDRHVLIVSVWADGEGHYVAAAVGSKGDASANFAFVKDQTNIIGVDKNERFAIALLHGNEHTNAFQEE